ncbi:MAG: hypothetical protein AB7K09_18670 [Planctomycetota bacterium]
MRSHLYWTHIVITTYGAWLLGDARGFRTRDHREHVEGHYKNRPAPGKYEKRAANSRRALSRPPVRLTASQREIVGTAIRERFESLGCTVAALCVASMHLHAMVGCPQGNWKRVVGFAKRHAWHELNTKTGFTGDLWGRGSKVIPLRTRDHQVRTYLYIKDHAERGAWLWVWKDRDKSEHSSVIRKVAHGRQPVGFNRELAQLDRLDDARGGTR